MFWCGLGFGAFTPGPLAAQFGGTPAAPVPHGTPGATVPGGASQSPADDRGGTADDPGEPIMSTLAPKGVPGPMRLSVPLYRSKTKNDATTYQPFTSKKGTPFNVTVRLYSLVNSNFVPIFNETLAITSGSTPADGVSLSPGDGLANPTSIADPTAKIKGRVEVVLGTDPAHRLPPNLLARDIWFSTQVDDGKTVHAESPRHPLGISGLVQGQEIWPSKIGAYSIDPVSGMLSGPAAPLFKGEPGDQGVPGPQGPQGAKGNKGNTGATGPGGPTGPLGPQGPVGAVGPVGPKGNTGSVGPLGPTGPVGPQGLQGIQGNDGPEGPRGPTGPLGDQGVPGPMGLQGPQGYQGFPGARGPTGPAGPAGTQGATGPTWSGGNVTNMFASNPGLAIWANHSNGDVRAGRDVIADNDLRAGDDISAGGSVSADDGFTGASLSVTGDIATGGDVNADDRIVAGLDISAGGDVNAGGSVNAILDVIAGRDLFLHNEIIFGDSADETVARVVSYGEMWFGRDVDCDDTDPTWFSWYNCGNLAMFLNDGEMLLQGGQASLYVDGDVYANGFDLAEIYPTRDNRSLVPGTVVAVDTERSAHVVAAERYRAEAVIGIVTTDPGLVLGGSIKGSRPELLEASQAAFERGDESLAQQLRREWTATENSRIDQAAIALSGRVPVRIDPSSAPIASGEAIGLGYAPGLAARWDGSGPTIALALEDWDGRSDSVLAYVHLDLSPDASAATTSAPTQPVAPATRGGTAVLRAGSQSVIVRDDAASADALPMVTFYGNPGSWHWIAERGDGYFVVELQEPATSDVTLGYQIP